LWIVFNLKFVFVILWFFIKGTSPVQQTPEPKIEPAAKPRGFEELDVLGEALMKQNLSSTSKPIVGFHQKAPEKVPLNMLAKKKMLDEHVLSKESTGNLLRTVYLLLCLMKQLYFSRRACSCWGSNCASPLSATFKHTNGFRFADAKQPQSSLLFSGLIK